MAANPETGFDQARAEEFAESMVEVINKGSLAVMLSIGHRTGLFDAMDGQPPATSAEIAARAGLVERYVREWLGAMVVGGVVGYDPAGERYHLPPEHAACLTRAATPNNLAVYAQYIPLLGTVEDRVIECFASGGGVPYDAFPRFHEVMAEDSGQTVVPALLDHILPLAPGVRERLERGIDVLDVGCGRGLALALLAATFPNSRFTGYDLSAEAVAWARDNAARQRLTNLHFEARDLTSFDEPGSYDLITAFDAIHDQKRPDLLLAGIARALRPGGVFLMQDIGGHSHLPDNHGYALAPLLYTVSCLHCMTVSLAQDGLGLGAMWGRERAVEMLGAAGFADVAVHELAHDIQNVYFVGRTDGARLRPTS